MDHNPLTAILTNAFGFINCYLVYEFPKEWSGQFLHFHITANKGSAALAYTACLINTDIVATVCLSNSGFSLFVAHRIVMQCIIVFSLYDCFTVRKNNTRLWLNTPPKSPKITVLSAQKGLQKKEIPIPIKAPEIYFKYCLAVGFFSLFLSNVMHQIHIMFRTNPIIIKLKFNIMFFPSFYVFLQLQIQYKK